ncbi:MAG: hypothetical protein DRP85_04880 [Candidatus Makaraimicrobium thalassicum]|nr:MAG: hypothetical protein DRP85_04880 [Candidatus Omnitrophota bacterium]
MRKRIVMIVLGFLLFGIGGANAEESGEQKDSLLDMVKKPLRTIFAPIHGEGLVDLVAAPAEVMLSPIIDLGEIVITPGRTHEYIFNINKNISVIDAEDIKQTNPRRVQQMISQKAGVVMSGYFGNAKDNGLDMRGFGETGLLNYLVLIDGRRSNQIDMSGADLSQIDLNSIERIEIMRGANSVLYGDNATGGVINIITKRGGTGDHIEYVQELGSYQYNKEYFSAGGGHDFLDYFFSYAYQDSEGYRLNNAYEANDIFTSFTVKPGDILDIHFSSNYHRDWYGQPGALYPENIRNDGREGSRFPNSKGKTEDYYFTVDPRVFRELGDHEGVLSSFVSYRSRRTNALSVGFGEYETNHHIVSLDFRPKCEINSTFFEDTLENKLVFGTDYFYAKDQVLSGDRTFRKSQLDIIKETFGIYASNNMLVNKRFIINGGIRGEWAEFIFDQFQPAASYDTQSPEEVAFDAGLGYKYNERSQIYANFARSYRYPATDEFFQSAYEYLNWWTGAVTVFPSVLNADLKHQVGNNYEIGIKDNSFGFLNVNASYYLIDNKNEIYYDPITFQNENYHHTVHHGFEFETKADIFEKIDAFFTYTFQKAFFVGGKYAGKHIPMVPQNKISAGIDIKPIDGLDAKFILNHVGARRITSDQVNEVARLKPHVTFDFNVSYETENYRLFGGIKNIFNEEYFSSAAKDWLGNAAFYPAPERTFEFGVGCKF